MTILTEYLRSKLIRADRPQAEDHIQLQVPAPGLTTTVFQL